jgi:hypothetical protein
MLDTGQNIFRACESGRGNALLTGWEVTLSGCRSTAQQNTHKTLVYCWCMPSQVENINTSEIRFPVAPMLIDFIRKNIIFIKYID